MSTYKERRQHKQQATELTTETCIVLLAQGVQLLEITLDSITCTAEHFAGLSDTDPLLCSITSDELMQLVTTAEELRQLMAQAYSQGGLFPFTDYNSRVNLAALSMREPAQEAALLVRAYAEISNSVTEEALRLRLRVQEALAVMIAVVDRALLHLHRVVEEAQGHTTVTAEGLRLLGSGGQQQ